MSEECTHNCSTCPSASGCTSKEKESMMAPAHPFNRISNVIAVISGKGGVGKSFVTSALAVLMRRKGYDVGVLDADITGPSIPHMFGIDKPAMGSPDGLYPQKSHNDTAVMSINLLLETKDTPVIWRGPILAGTVKQFWSDVIWGKLDILFVDMPPGTGDVPLTVFQSLPVTGVVIVTSPQELVSVIVKKAYNMAKMMNIPILGLIENMSSIQCPGCGEVIYPFGKGSAEKYAEEMGIPLLAKLPVDPRVAELADKGEIEKLNMPEAETAANAIEGLLKKQLPGK
ncbi:MAG: P-loop NTPase [Christensenellales bacterium]